MTLGKTAWISQSVLSSLIKADPHTDISLLIAVAEMFDCTATCYSKAG